MGDSKQPTSLSAALSSAINRPASPDARRLENKIYAALSCKKVLSNPHAAAVLTFWEAGDLDDGPDGDFDDEYWDKDRGDDFDEPEYDY